MARGGWGDYSRKAIILNNLVKRGFIREKRLIEDGYYSKKYGSTLSSIRVYFKVAF